MDKIHLQIFNLRKEKGVTQGDLADHLGVTFQSVSKWENGVSFPDIELLPKIASYFKVSVDQLLGLSNAYSKTYESRKTHTSAYWDGRANYLKQSRSSLWNADYFEFLVGSVWKLDKPIDVIDFGCGMGYLGEKIMPLLAEGSSYTGVDISGELLEKAKDNFVDKPYQAEFIQCDILEFNAVKKYDLALCQALLRHIQKPVKAIETMKSSLVRGGLAVAIEVNRPFEVAGTYVEAYEYTPCDDMQLFKKLWKSELDNEGRDYAIGIKLPLLFEEAGLVNVDVRMNDKVLYSSKNTPRLAKKEIEDFKVSKGWSGITHDQEKNIRKTLKSRGLTEEEIESFLNKNKCLSEHFSRQDDWSFVSQNGMVITYGLRV